jgi:hypothetical protein
MKPWLVVPAILAFMAAAAAQPGLPAALRSAVDTTTEQQAPYAFDLHLESTKLNWRARFDPSRAAPKLQLVSPGRDAMTHEQRTAFDRQAEDMEGVVWCANEYMGRIADVRLLRQDAGSATYSFQPTRESVRDQRAKRYAQHLRGEFTMTKGKPDISAIRTYAPATFSPFPLVRLSTLDIRIACSAAPNGRNYAATVETTISGTAVGKAFSDRSVQRVYNLRASR